MLQVNLPEGKGTVKPDGCTPQILGDVRVEYQRLTAHGVLEGEPFGVKPETMAGDLVAVKRVSIHRMADCREVNPDLVRPP